MLNRATLLRSRAREERRGGSVLWHNAGPAGTVLDGTFFGSAELGRARTVWRTVPGLHYDATWTEPLTVDCKVWPCPDQGTLTSVTFYVSVNGGAPSSTVVSAKEVRVPNYTDTDSPLPGVTSGMGWVWQTGIDIDLSSLAGGTVVVWAVARSTLNGVNYDTPIRDELWGDWLVFYNDTDGVDRRPSQTDIYVSPTGSDSNDGLTSGAPLLTFRAAINTLVGEDGSDLRGGKIIAMAGAHLCGGNYGGSGWQSGKGWLTIDFQSGASVQRVLDADANTVYPDSYMMVPGVSGGNCFPNVRLRNARVLSSGFVMAIGVEVDRALMWFDGGSSASMHDDGTNNLAKYIDDTGEMVGKDGAGATRARHLSTNHTCEARVDGFTGSNYLQDCLVDRWSGLAVYDTGDSECMHTVNVLVREQDYIRVDAESTVRGVIDYQPGTAATISSQVGGAHAGKMRIAFTGAPYDVGTSADDGLVGSLKLGLKVTGATSGANNGTFQVLEGGSGYVILDNSSEVPEAGGASLRLVTARWTSSGFGQHGTTWNDLVHPDVWRIQGNRNPTVHVFACDTTVLSTQAMFTAGYNCERSVFDEITMPADCRNNFDGSRFTKCTFRHITAADGFDFGGGASCPDSVFHDIVADSWSTTPLYAKSITACHNITGGAIGSGGTTGAWFDNYATNGYLPASGVRGNDSGLVDRPDAAKWLTDTDWSQGAGEWVGEADWTEPTGGSAITGAGAGTFGITGSAAGSSSISGTGAGSFTITGSATGTSGISGSGAGTLSFTGAAVGTVSVVGIGAGSIDFTGAGSGLVLVAGTGAGSLGLTGAAAGGSGNTGAAAGTLDLTGAATGATAIAGVGAGTLSLSGAADGSVTITGAGAGTLELTGAAAGTSTIAGAGAGSLLLTGAAAGTSSISGEGAGVFSFEGAAAGIVTSTGGGPPPAVLQPPPGGGQITGRRWNRSQTFTSRRQTFGSREWRAPRR